MAKDPAVLFYFDHWRGGTMTLTRFLKGCYIDLLDAQFNNGHLSLEEIKTVLGSDFGQSWPTLQKKFIKDSEGLFFNERLQVEVDKRKKYISRQTENGKSGGRPKKETHGFSMALPKEKHLVNVNGNVNGFGKSENLLWSDSKNSFLNSTDGWEYNFCVNKKISQEVLKRAMREFIIDIELKEDFKDVSELRNHFVNWYNQKSKYEPQKESSAPPLRKANV